MGMSPAAMVSTGRSLGTSRSRAVSAEPPIQPRSTVATRCSTAPTARAIASTVAESSPPESSTTAGFMRMMNTMSFHERLAAALVAGSTEHYEDAALYDHEYGRRRDDVRWYRALAQKELGK